ncbi:hypothetical protein [Streptomyces lydicus]|uniref:hypothetical protein n=1 Tax=Streptomyces lydicus TaxID=47763 RepID=UPI0037A2B45A
MTINDFTSMLRELRSQGWNGIQGHSEEGAQKLARSGGIDANRLGSIKREGIFSPLGVSEVFFRGGDIYYVQIVSRRMPRLRFDDTEELYFSLAGMRRNIHEKKILQVGIVSARNDPIEEKLNSLVSDVETAISATVDGRRVRHFSYDWRARQAPRSRIEAIRKRFDEEGIDLSVAEAELDPAKLAAALILENDSNRSLLLELKTAGFARETDILARRGAKAEETKAALEVLKSGGLVKSEHLLQCRKTNSMLIRIGSVEALNVDSVSGLTCASCSRKFKDELVIQGHSVSALGRELSNSSNWMTYWVTDKLVSVGVPLSSIYWNLEESGEEVDIIADFMGELWLIELKDREFGAGDAHPFNYRTVRYGSDRSFIISTDKVSPDAKKVFNELNRTARPSHGHLTSGPQYIEGLSSVSVVFGEEVNRTASQRAHSYLEVPQLLTGYDLQGVLQ